MEIRYLLPVFIYLEPHLFGTLFLCPGSQNLESLRSVPAPLPCAIEGDPPVLLHGPSAGVEIGIRRGSSFGR